MKKLNDTTERQDYSYSDQFFEKGHYLLKFKQLVVAIVGWICFVVPTYITLGVFFYFISHGKIGKQFWRYSEGIVEIKFLLLILAFCVAITFTYATCMTIIQNNRREATIEKWPTFDSVSSIERRKRGTEFMEERFGSEKFRHNIKYFEVAPEMNLKSGELSDVLDRLKK
ncbi:hypothetical protein ABLU29_03270 [Lactococcus lactis]|uniref:hypothetical protein n=1 Tax=Lactococcus lactis TaxID=1358 RepID=UPI0038780C8D